MVELPLGVPDRHLAHHLDGRDDGASSASTSSLSPTNATAPTAYARSAEISRAVSSISRVSDSPKIEAQRYTTPDDSAFPSVLPIG